MSAGFWRRLFRRIYYYPFGMGMEGSWSNVVSEPENKYLFSGVERNTDLGLDLDLTFYRSYDPAIGRWMQIDPKAELFYAWTPYKFSLNNPILYNDPNGDCETCGVLIGAFDNIFGTNVRSKVNMGSAQAQAEFDAGANKSDKVFLVAGTLMTLDGAAKVGAGAALAPAALAEPTPIGESVAGGLILVGATEAAAGSWFANNAAKNLGNDGKVNMDAGGSAKESFRNAEPGSPALKDNPYSPGNVSKRQSQTRRERGVTPDPGVPIPDQPPGKNIKSGVHSSEGKNRHSTGERNVSSKEEHSRVAKGNNGGNRNNRN